MSSTACFTTSVRRCGTCSTPCKNAHNNSSSCYLPHDSQHFFDAIQSVYNTRTNVSCCAARPHKSTCVCTSRYNTCDVSVLEALGRLCASAGLAEGRHTERIDVSARRPETANIIGPRLSTFLWAAPGRSMKESAGAGGPSIACQGKRAHGSELDQVLCL